MSSCQVTVRGSVWEQAIQEGITAWNVSTGNRDAGVTITPQTTGSHSHRFEVRTRSITQPSVFGTISIPRTPNNIFTSSIARIYSLRIDEFVQNMSDPNNAAQNVARSVAAHEMGHLFGLEDNPPGNTTSITTSIMRHGRDRTVITSHNAFDARNVRLIFGAP